MGQPEEGLCLREGAVSRRECTVMLPDLGLVQQPCVEGAMSSGGALCSIGTVQVDLVRPAIVGAGGHLHGPH